MIKTFWKLLGRFVVYYVSVAGVTILVTMMNSYVFEVPWRDLLATWPLFVLPALLLFAIHTGLEIFEARRIKP